MGELINMEPSIGKRIIAIIVLTLVTAIFAILAGLEIKQIISVTLFGLKTYETILLWRYRLPFAFMAIFLLLGFGVLDVPHLIEFASFDVILFLISMMIVVGFLEEKAFFEYLIHRIVKIAGLNSQRLVVILMCTSALFAALVDEVTSILFIATIVLHLTRKYKVNPIPFLLMVVFTTNIGSSATVIGNPVGVMIAFKGGLTFLDFLRWASPISVLALILTIILSMKIFSNDIRTLDSSMKSYEPSEGGEEEVAPPKEGLITCWAIFIGTITFLALHHPLEELFHLERNTLLIGTAMAAASIVLLIDLEGGREIVARRVDWRTILFFALLFASVGTLQYVGITELLAKALLSFSGGSDLSMLVLFTSLAAVLSGFLDNVLAVATFIPVVSFLEAAGAHAFPLWWATLFSGTFFGNLTIIGSTANIVANGLLERTRGMHIAFSDWIKKGALISVATLALAIIVLYLQIPIMP
jgi:Na+/H+ antiporter NhaD/arsenite permease-like protein